MKVQATKIALAMPLLAFGLISCQPAEGTRITCGHLSLVIPVGYKLEECNDGHQKPTAVSIIAKSMTVSGIGLLRKDRDAFIDVRILASKESSYFIGLFGESTDAAQLGTIDVDSIVWHISEDGLSAFAEIPSHDPMILTVYLTGEPSDMDVPKILDQAEIRFAE